MFDVKIMAVKIVRGIADKVNLFHFNVPRLPQVRDHP